MTTRPVNTEKEKELFFKELKELIQFNLTKEKKDRKKLPQVLLENYSFRNKGIYFI